MYWQPSNCAQKLNSISQDYVEKPSLYLNLTKPCSAVDLLSKLEPINYLSNIVCLMFLVQLVCTVHSIRDLKQRRRRLLRKRHFQKVNLWCLKLYRAYSRCSRATTAKKCTKKAWCTCKVVILSIMLNLLVFCRSRCRRRRRCLSSLLSLCDLFNVCKSVSIYIL